MIHHTHPTSRRWGLIALVAVLALFQGTAALHARQIPADLAAQISLPVPVEFAVSGLWALLFAAITVNLIRGRALRPALFSLSSFVVYTMARLLLFARADYDHHRLPFLLAAAICLLVFPAAVLLHR